jgi:peptide/nickel transport system substrate-binding protein
MKFAFWGLAIVSTLCAAADAGAVQIKGAKGPGPVPADLFNDPIPSGKKVVPKRGGTLVMQQDAFGRAFDADFDTAAVTSEMIKNYVQENLVDFDWETWKPTPSLAEKYTQDDSVILKAGDQRILGKATEQGDTVIVDLLDGGGRRTLRRDEVKSVEYGTVFTFDLRRGVKFHNGQEFTAKDVDFTYRLLRSPHNQMPHIQSYMARVADIIILNPYKVRLIYQEQYWMALSAVAGYAYIRPWTAYDPDELIWKDEKAFCDKFREHKLLNEPVGTGPYQFKEGKKGYSLRLERFEEYWNRAHVPQWPDQIVFRAINDPVASLKALEAGEIDYIERIPDPKVWREFFKDPKHVEQFAAVETLYTAYFYVGWNCTHEIFRDRKVRLALAYGMADFDKFIAQVLDGKGVRCICDQYRYGPYYNPDLKPIPYDPTKAVELLEEAGWFDSDGDGVIDKNGRPFRFELLNRTMPETNPAWQLTLMYKENLKKIGIDMQIKTVEWSTMLDLVGKGDFEACTLGWGLASPPDQQDMFQLWHSSQIGGDGSNHVKYANRELDDLLVKRRRELDFEKGRQLEFRMAKILYENQPYCWTYMPAFFQAYNKKWRGVKLYVPRPGRRLNEWHLYDVVNP